MTEPTKTTLPGGTIEYRNAKGQRHREDGPAFTWPDGLQAWYLNGQDMTQDEHAEAVAKIRSGK